MLYPIPSYGSGASVGRIMLNTRNCDPFSRSPTYSTEEDSNEAIEIALISFNCSPVPGLSPSAGQLSLFQA